MTVKELRDALANIPPELDDVTVEVVGHDWRIKEPLDGVAWNKTGVVIYA